MRQLGHWPSISSGTVNIRQIQIAYVPAEDRLLWRINTDEQTEVRMWLTRRLMLSLWPSLAKAAEDATMAARPGAGVAANARRAVAEFAREAAVAQADFSKPFVSPAGQLPLGDSPRLVVEVALSRRASGETSLSLKLDGDGALEIAMAESLLHAFCTLLQRESVRAGWGIMSASAPAALVEQVPHSAMN